MLKLLKAKLSNLARPKSFIKSKFLIEGYTSTQIFVNRSIASSFLVNVSIYSVEKVVE